MGVKLVPTLTAPQIAAIATAAAILYPTDRDAFIAAVTAELEGQPIGDGTIGRAIRAVQPKFAHPEPEAPPRWSREAPRFERTSKRGI
jgi:hypothetical protein